LFCDNLFGNEQYFFSDDYYNENFFGTEDIFGEVVPRMKPGVSPLLW